MTRWLILHVATSDSIFTWFSHLRSPLLRLAHIFTNILIYIHTYSHDHSTCDSPNSSHDKPLTMDVGCQYRLLDTVATPTLLSKQSPPKLSSVPKLLPSSQSSSSAAAPPTAAPATKGLTRFGKGVTGYSMYLHYILI